MLLGIKRIYDKASITDGRRILVDGIWPRGVRKSTANIDTWLKDVAPSKELRMWFSHDPDKWEEFRSKYKKELRGNKALDNLIDMVTKEDITLIYSSRDEEHNNALVLKEVIEERIEEFQKS
jgi:uncharacterized protein YeaO (DUF488 family)